MAIEKVDLKKNKKVKAFNDQSEINLYQKLEKLIDGQDALRAASVLARMLDEVFTFEPFKPEFEISPLVGKFGLNGTDFSKENLQRALKNARQRKQNAIKKKAV